MVVCLLKAQLRFRESFDNPLIAECAPFFNSYDFSDRFLADAQTPGAITGVVYGDWSGDGFYDPGEPGLANVQVCLTPLSGPQVCTTTNAGGQYAFLNLPPGAYTVTETDPAGHLSTGDADGASNGLSTIAVTVPAGVTVTERNFFDTTPTGIHFLGLQTLPGDASIELRWQVRPVDGSGLPRFHMWRAVPEGAWKRLTVTLLEPVSAAGDVLEYSYVDTSVETGVTYLYQLEMEDGFLIGPWQVKASLARHFFYLPLMRR